MKKRYIREMAIALLAAVAVGYAFNALIGAIAFFVVGAFLSKGSVPKTEMKNVIKPEDAELGCGYSLDRGIEYTHLD